MEHTDTAFIAINEREEIYVSLDGGREVSFSKKTSAGLSVFELTLIDQNGEKLTLTLEERQMKAVAEAAGRLTNRMTTDLRERA